MEYHISGCVSRTTLTPVLQKGLKNSTTPFVATAVDPRRLSLQLLPQLFVKSEVKVLLIAKLTISGVGCIVQVCSSWVTPTIQQITKAAAAVHWCLPWLWTCWRFSSHRYLSPYVMPLMGPILKVCFDLLCSQINKLFFLLHGFSPHDYVCEVRLYSWTGARANWITSPNVPSSVLLFPSWRHNVITRWCPLFGELLFWCCVHEFINSTLWLVIHRRAAEAEPVQYESFGDLSG